MGTGKQEDADLALSWRHGVGIIKCLVLGRGTDKVISSEAKSTLGRGNEEYEVDENEVKEIRRGRRWRWEEILIQRKTEE